MFLSCPTFTDVTKTVQLSLAVSEKNKSHNKVYLTISEVRDYEREFVAEGKVKEKKWTLCI